MSELHNLSAPIEDTPEDIQQKELKQKEISKNQSREDLLNLIRKFKEKYLKKLFLALGIAVTICIILIWALSKLLPQPENNSPKQPVEDQPAESASETNTQNIKFIKFEGHQYSFYVPEGYSFLNRTRNDDLNEVVFQDNNGARAFVLQEFEANNDNEETLDSIYAYISTTLPPSENSEITIGENTFKHRIYKSCLEIVESNREATDSNTECLEGKDYYSIYINGIIIIFETTDSKNKELEEKILNTFSKNLIDTQVLTEEYIYAKLPTVKNKLQSLFAFGAPIKKPANREKFDLTWQTAIKDLTIKLTFSNSDELITADGIIKNKFSYDLLSAIEFKEAVVSQERAYDLLMESKYGEKSKTGNIQITSDPLNENLWNIKVSASEEDGGLLIGEYNIDKTTGKISEVLN